jgi:hypothetical protein
LLREAPGSQETITVENDGKTTLAIRMKFKKTFFLELLMQGNSSDDSMAAVDVKKVFASSSYILNIS